MAFLHNKMYVHLDLKAANLLVDIRDRVKVGDLGLARKMEGDADYIGASGQYHFSCPNSLSTSNCIVIIWLQNLVYPTIEAMVVQ